MRTVTLEQLADIVRTCNDVGGGSTICTIRAWEFWKDSLTEEELRELYRMILKATRELYETKGYKVD